MFVHGMPTQPLGPQRRSMHSVGIQVNVLSASKSVKFSEFVTLEVPCCKILWAVLLLVNMLVGGPITELGH